MRQCNPGARTPGGYEELVALGPIELGRAGGHVLALSFAPPRGLVVELSIDGTLVVAIDDNTRHGLRYGELEQLVRFAAVCSDLPHPGWLLALTSRAAPIVEADGDYPIHLLERALALALVTSESSRFVFQQSDARGAGLSWRRTGERWHIEQAAGYASGTRFALRSKRDVGGKFPHELLAAMLAAIDTAFAWRTPAVRDLARQVAAGDRDVRVVLGDALLDAGCDRPVILDALSTGDRSHEAWVLELILGLTPGALLGPMLGASARLPGQHWRGIVTTFADDATAQRMRTALRRRGFGFDPSEHGSLRVQLRGDFEQALARYVAELRRAGAPRGTTVWVGGTRIIPL